MKIQKKGCSMSLYTPSNLGVDLKIRAIAARFTEAGIISDEHKRFLADQKEKEACFQTIRHIYIKHGYDKTARRQYKIYDKYGFVRP